MSEPFRISPIEILALRKLELVAKALALKLGDYRAAREQAALAQALGDVLDRYEIHAGTEPSETP